VKDAKILKNYVTANPIVTGTFIPIFKRCHESNYH